jgi:hypothetical protein
VLSAFAFVLATAVAGRAQGPALETAPPAAASAPSQSELEAQLSKMIDDLRRENARRRGAPAEAAPASPAAPPARAPVVRRLPTALVVAPRLRTATLAPPRPARARLDTEPLAVATLPAARLSPPPSTVTAAGPPPAPDRPTLSPPAPRRADGSVVASPDVPRDAPSVLPAAPELSPAPVAVAGLGPLPAIEGFTPEEVHAFIGAPHTIQQPARGLTTWYYTTPAGRLPVYFINDLATFAAPSLKRGAPAPAPRRREPPRIGSCDGIVAVLGPKLLHVSATDTPIFIEPRFRQVPLALLAQKARLEVVRPEGAWYLVRFSDERWGKRNGYVHCGAVEAP